jgi:hypothetical protein
MNDDSLILKLQQEKLTAIKYQSRRHEAWRDIYNLYRDIVETNDLTQRQEVNIPIMKETKKTLSSRIDDTPDIFFDCLELGPKGREKEIIVNEKWRDDYDTQNYEGVDVLEKNNVLLFGRTFKILNLNEGAISVSVPHRLDIVVDPKMDPLNIETAKYFVRLHIYKSLREILASNKYTKEGKDNLKKYLQDKMSDESGQGGLIKFDKDDTQEAKEEILTDLGIDNFDDLFAADVEVELNEHFTLIWDEKKKKFIRYVVVVADNNIILYKKTLKDTIGVDFWPATTWADDIDTDDIWPDGMGDIVKIPNKIMNVYFSALTENWTYRGLGMSWYLPAAGYDPQTFSPEPFGQYPAPLIPMPNGGYMSVEQVVKQMDIPAIDNDLVGIDFLIKLVERATAATAIEKGQTEKGQMTLGEVEQLISKASERIVNISKFYRRAWKEFAWKWRKMLEANAKGSFKLYKKGPKGNYYEKEVKPKDWLSGKGFRERVLFKNEKGQEMVEEFNKLSFLSKNYPDNKVIQKIVRKRVLEKLDLTPDEMREIEDMEKQMEQAQIPTAPQGMIPQNQQQNQPQQPVNQPINNKPVSVGTAK